MRSLQLSVSPKFWAALCVVCFGFVAQAAAQDPVVVQPGAPGQPTRTLSPDTRPSLPPTTKKDVEFMQGMIMHHAQAVDMVALMYGRVQSRELQLLGARISHSQAEEMNFMKRWLVARGESTEMPKKMAGMNTSNMPGMNIKMPVMDQPMLMPGMLTAAQMDALAKAKGKEFDRLFLQGMIQHHGGALTMVKELFDSAAAGQDSVLFNFASDVDSGQRAEIGIMQGMLDKIAAKN